MDFLDHGLDQLNGTEHRGLIEQSKIENSIPAFLKQMTIRVRRGRHSRGIPRIVFLLRKH